MDRSKKSPEEMQQIMNSLKTEKEKQKRKDDIKNVRNGQIIIFVIAGIMMLSSVLIYNQLNQEIAVFYIYAPIIVLFILLGVFYYKNPFIIPIVALVIYGGLVLLDAAADPDTLRKGIFIKIIVISGLVRAIKYGKDYQAAISHPDDMLDQGI